MKTLRTTFGLVFTILIVATVPAQAATIYNNGGPNTESGYSIEGTSSIADDFTLAAAATVGGVGFYFQNYEGITGWDQDVSYLIHADAAGAPGVVLASGAGQNVLAVDSGQPWCCGGGNAFLVTFDLLASFNALPTVTYWLELTGATSSNGSAWWVTADANGTNPSPESGGEFGFYLTGGESAAPEPGSMGLLSLGVLAIGLVRYRRSVRAAN